MPLVLRLRPHYSNSKVLSSFFSWWEQKNKLRDSRQVVNLIVLREGGEQTVKEIKEARGAIK